MKKIHYLFIVVVCILILVGWKLSHSQNSWHGFTITSYHLHNKEYRLLVADNLPKWIQGLMNVKSKPPGIDGMIFLFPDTAPRSFWNENTNLDLKLVWLNNDVVLGETILPSIQKTGEVMTVVSPKPANKVIELIQ